MVFKGGGYLGSTTNNVAEYQALIKGVEKCRELKIKKIIIRMDSQLVVRQIEGSYKVKTPHLRPLYVEAQTLLSTLESFSIEHVRREENSLADSLANLALDNRKTV